MFIFIHREKIFEIHQKELKAVASYTRQLPNLWLSVTALGKRLSS